MLTIENVTKRFGAIVALDGVSLSLARGEFFGLLGPNGAGKTTLMSLVAGLRAPDCGSICLRHVARRARADGGERFRCSASCSPSLPRLRRSASGVFATGRSSSSEGERLARPHAFKQLKNSSTPLGDGVLFFEAGF
jgi:ABC-type polar amino acid transport system ATPase subunit